MQDTLDYLRVATIDPTIKGQVEQMCRHAFANHSTENPPITTLMRLLEQGIPITIITGWASHGINRPLSKLIWHHKMDLFFSLFRSILALPIQVCATN